MAASTLVLVHGANHTSACWEPTIAAIGQLAPDLDVLALDLPGRGSSRPIDPRSISVSTCATAVVDQIDEVGAEQVVLVGHSLGGALVPSIAGALGAERLEHLVFFAATVPPDGRAVIDTMPAGVRLSVRLTAGRAARRGSLTSYPRRLAASSFCNGMTDEQQAFVLDHLCPDASWLTTEPISQDGLPRTIARTWILTTQDHAVKPAQQRRNIDNLGGVDDVVELDAGHDAMVGAPAALASILVDIVARHGGVGP